MESYIADYLTRLDDIYDGIIDAVGELPQEALDWCPADGLNSINVLVAHTAGSGRYWIGDMAVGDPKPRDRGAEFAAKGLTAADIKARLDEVRSYAHTALANVTMADLARERTTISGQGVTATHTANWALLHALEHSAIHAGHIHMMRDWWNARQ